MAISVILFALALLLFFFGSNITVSLLEIGEEKPTVTVAFLAFRFRIRIRREEKTKSAVRKKGKKKIRLGAVTDALKYLLAHSFLSVRSFPLLGVRSDLLFSFFSPTSAAGLSVLQAFAENTVVLVLSSVCGRVAIHTQRYSEASLDVSLSFSLFNGITAFLILINKIGKEKFNDRKATHRMDAGVA